MKIRLSHYLTGGLSDGPASVFAGIPLSIFNTIDLFNLTPQTGARPQLGYTCMECCGSPEYPTPGAKPEEKSRRTLGGKPIKQMTIIE